MSPVVARHVGGRRSRSAQSGSRYGVEQIDDAAACGDEAHAVDRPPPGAGRHADHGLVDRKTSVKRAGPLRLARRRMGRQLLYDEPCCRADVRCGDARARAASGRQFRLISPTCNWRRLAPCAARSSRARARAKLHVLTTATDPHAPSARAGDARVAARGVGWSSQG